MIGWPSLALRIAQPWTSHSSVASDCSAAAVVAACCAGCEAERFSAFHHWYCFDNLRLSCSYPHLFPQREREKRTEFGCSFSFFVLISTNWVRC